MNRFLDTGSIPVSSTKKEKRTLSCPLFLFDELDTELNSLECSALEYGCTIVPQSASSSLVSDKAQNIRITKFPSIATPKRVLFALVEPTWKFNTACERD